jgi:hypothetical protein
MAAARALYSEGPSAAEAAAFGLTVEEASGPPVEIWPDNLRAVNVFIALSTQWRTSANRPYGLDYNVLYHKLDRMDLTPAEYECIEEDIRMMEGAALVQIRAKQ